MEEITQGAEGADGVRAEADEDVMKPNLLQDHTPLRELRSTSTRSRTCLIEADADIAFMEEVSELLTFNVYDLSA